MNDERRHWIVFSLLLALGLAMRAFGAWVYEFSHTSDNGIICLMVRHMLEGKAFPVFFYGLPYMGSLEPAVSAGLCRLFGLTGFWINMGTALTAFAFLPLVYLWGRGAAGKVAGLAALAFCVIGPPQYFQFESWADGGYAAIPLLTCAVLVAGLRMLRRDMEGEPPGHLAFAGLGVLAGLGWWQSPLLIPAFLVCALLFLAVQRRRLLSWRLASGAGGFLLGSLPLWLWNLRNHWQTFDMVKTHDRPAFLEGLRLFYWDRMQSLMNVDRSPQPVMLALMGLLALLTVLAVVHAVRRWRQNRAETLYVAAALLYLLVYSILFGRSRFARVDAIRYVLVVIPVLAVLIGAATAWLAARVKAAGWLPLALLVAHQAIELPERPPERERAAAFIPKAMKLGEFLREKGIRHLYTDYQVRFANHGLNFVLEEEFVFSPVTRERYRPYAEALEQAEAPAVLNNHMGFSTFLRMTGGTSETAEVEDMLVHYNARPPAGGWLAMDEGNITNRTAAPGELVIRLFRPVPVCGVRLRCAGEDWPAALAVDLEDENGNWIPALAELPATRWFWSGDRFYWGGDAGRLECRFAPAAASAVRIRLKPSRTGAPAPEDVRLLLPSEGERSHGPGDLEALAEKLRAAGVRRVYADRWECNRLLPLLGPEVRYSLPPHLFGRESLPAEMSLDGATAVVTRRREGNALSALLESDRHAAASVAECGPWMVFLFRAPLPPHGAEPCLVWAGYGALRGDDGKWALLALKTIREAEKSGTLKKDAAALALLAGQARAFLPDHRPLAEAEAACLKAQGLSDMAARANEEGRLAWIPDIPLAARFKGGVELVGLKAVVGEGLFVRKVGEVAAGKSVEMKFLWKIPRGLDGTPWVFVHFKRDGKTLFQDDHPLPAELGAWMDPGDITVEARRVRVPADAGPGPVTVELGLFTPGEEGGRIPFKAPDQSEKSLTLPGSILIR